MIEKTGSARWEGTLKKGTGHVSTQSGALSDQPYGFNTRFEGQTGTNPEELIGAAHAGCFSMALSMILGEKDRTPDKIETRATVGLEEVEGGFAITRVHLDVTATVPGMSEEDFAEAAEKAKENCPVSKLLAGAEITMRADLA